MKGKRNPQKFEVDLPSGKIAAKPITPTNNPITTIFITSLFKRQISYRGGGRGGSHNNGDGCDKCTGVDGIQI